jgi:hypothetical protein
MSGGEIYSNAATDTGGGVQVSGGTFTFSAGTIRSNNAGTGSAGGGGGVGVSSGTATMSGGVIRNNQANSYCWGGGVLISGGRLNLSSNIMIYGSANGGGNANTANSNSALYVAGGTVSPAYGSTNWTIQRGDGVL